MQKGYNSKISRDNRKNNQRNTASSEYLSKFDENALLSKADAQRDDFLREREKILLERRNKSLCMSVTGTDSSSACSAHVADPTNYFTESNNIMSTLHVYYSKLLI